MNILIIACTCFVFSHFYSLGIPSLLPAFPAINTTVDTSAFAVVCEALLPLTDALLAAIYSIPVCTFWTSVLQTVLPGLAYSTTAASPVPCLIRPVATFSKGKGQRMNCNAPVCKYRPLYAGCS